MARRRRSKSPAASSVRSPHPPSRRSISETHPLSPSATSYIFSGTSSSFIPASPPRLLFSATSPRSLLLSLASLISSLLLPVGPVRPSYYRYQCFDSLQGLCSYLRSVLATSAVLTAIGVGSSAASPIAAAVTWALRDGAGLLTSLAFTSLNAPSFRLHIREYRLFADVINDVGLFVDMILPHFPPRFLLAAAAFSTACKACCGVAAAATRSDITMFFALDGNVSDLIAKEGSQETAVTLVGILLGSYLASLLPDSELVKLAVFSLLTAVHVLANYRAVLLLRLPAVNFAVLASLSSSRSPCPGPDDIQPSLLTGFSHLLHPRVRLGVSISSLTFPSPPDLSRGFVVGRTRSGAAGVAFGSNFDSLLEIEKRELLLAACFAALAVPPVPLPDLLAAGWAFSSTSLPLAEYRYTNSAKTD